jgi:hypothetical protein
MHVPHGFFAIMLSFLVQGTVDTTFKASYGTVKEGTNAKETASWNHGDNPGVF